MPFESLKLKTQTKIRHLRQDRIEKSFIKEFFDEREEFEEYKKEVHEDAVDIYKNALEKYGKLTEKNNMGAIGIESGIKYYALIRKTKPDKIVETGVCNGLSTLFILAGIQKNKQGELYSIDYPYRANESLDEFKNETFDEYGGAAIPSNKEPGWIIPEKLKDNWHLNIGKSQRRTPEILEKLGETDMFFHDSEHSFPCMIFEYELAYEYLNNDGIIISDDINWNQAFSRFASCRSVKSGLLAPTIGYMIKK